MGVRAAPCGDRTRDNTLPEHMPCLMGGRGKKGFGTLGFVTDTAIYARWPRKAGHVIADIVVIAHPPPSARLALLHICWAAWRTILRLWRRLQCTSHVEAGRPTSISDDLPLCIESAASQNAHVQHVRGGALQIDASHWVALHHLGSLRLHLAISRYSFLLPWILHHTAASPL